MDALAEPLAPPAAMAASEDALRRPFEELAHGSPDALEAIWELVGRRLYALAYWRTGNEHDARDVVQDVFVKLATRRHELPRVKSPEVWLLSVTHRAAVDLTRRRAVRRADPLEAAAHVEASDGDPEKAAEARRVSQALATLPDAQREAVSLRHLLGHSFREVAEITGVPTFTAVSRCRLGLQRLKNLLGGPS